MWQPYPPYHHERYDKVWAACQDLDMPVHVHSGAADKESYGEFVGMYVAEVRWWSTRPLWFLLWSGKFEQFPGLRFVVTECGAFWAADLLWTSDLVYDREHAAKKLGHELTSHLTMRPSEYFDRNCSIGASNTRRRELGRRYEIGVGNLMWGNDFPHPEGTWPHTKEWLRTAFCDIPIDETQADPRHERGCGLPLRHRRPGSTRRPHRADTRGAGPDRPRRHGSAREVGGREGGRSALDHRGRGGRGADRVNELAGRTAVVIGGGSGVGRGIALGLAAAGMRVAVADIHLESAQAVRDEIEGTGATAIAGAADATDRASLGAFAEEVVTQLGAVHVLVSTVGVIIDRRLDEATDDDWGWLLEFNLMAVVRGVNVFLPYLRAAR